MRTNLWICGVLAAIAAGPAFGQPDLADPVFAADALVAPGARENTACRAAQHYTQNVAARRPDLIGAMFTEGAIYYGAGDEPILGAPAIGQFYTLLMERSAPKQAKIVTLVPAGDHDCYMELMGSLRDYRAGATGQENLQPLPGAIDRFTTDDQGKVIQLYIFFRPTTFQLLKAAVESK